MIIRVLNAIQELVRTLVSPLVDTVLQTYQAVLIVMMNFYRMATATSAVLEAFFQMCTLKHATCAIQEQALTSAVRDVMDLHLMIVLPAIQANTSITLHLGSNMETALRSHLILQSLIITS